MSNATRNQNQAEAYDEMQRANFAVRHFGPGAWSGYARCIVCDTQVINDWLTLWNHMQLNPSHINRIIPPHSNEESTDEGERLLDEHLSSSGRWFSAKDAAEVLGVSVSKARRILERLQETGAFVCLEESRPSYDTGYKNVQVGAHRVSVYAPARRTLILAVKTARER